MTYAALQAILTEAKALLVDNQQILTVERLAALKKLVSLFKGYTDGPLKAVDVFTRAEAIDIMQTLEALIAHEETLQAGLADTLIQSITKVQGRPLEVRAIALFL